MVAGVLWRKMVDSVQTGLEKIEIGRKEINYQVI